MKATQWWPVIFPIAVFGSLIGGGFAMSRCESCYVPCSWEDVPPKLEVEQLGQVVMPDGETCHVEQVIERTFYHRNGSGPVDTENRCVGPTSTTRPLVRRIVCPSGRNGESKVGQDGTKSHHETLE